MSRQSTPEALLVHGGGLVINDHGISLSAGSIARAERAIQLHFENPFTQFVFSGGNAHGDDIPVSESRMMADMAVRAEVPHYLIECEEASSSTIGNVGKSLSILQGMGVESVGGISGRIASHRAKYILKTLVSRYRPNFYVSDYFRSDEQEGIFAYPREAASFVIAKYCLTSAKKENIPADELDAYFSEFKQQVKIADLKRKLTAYSF